MLTNILLLLILLLTLNLASSQCNHPIFCFEPILQTIAQSNIFQDSKSFVDLTLKVPINQAINIFRNENITSFVQKCFTSSDSIFQKVQFSDYNPLPQNLKKIKNQQLLKFALDLNKRWNQLGRRVNLNSKDPQSKCTQSCTSFIPQIDGRQIIIPGGRFKEAYYWDSYWIIKGLIECQMFDTTQKLLNNFALMIKVYGFIPNGFRLYYLNRSQPPFFFLMVKQFLSALLNKGQVDRALALEEEFFPILLKQNQYWMQNHAKQVEYEGRVFVLNQYKANTNSARPESYREDLKTVSNIFSQTQKKRVLKAISSIAESGYDFSSRWYLDKNLKIPIIDSLIPSDLNALLGLQQQYLAAICSRITSCDSSTQHNLISQANQRKLYFKLIKKQNRFSDLYVGEDKREFTFVYPSDYFPFIFLEQKIKKPSIFSDKINPVSSQINSGMQWDSPNVWAPNSWILHQILEDKEAQQIAFEWVKTVYCGWKLTGNIYQKYRNDKFGERGEGGQYQVQTGFGWTNGLTLYYLIKYGENIKINDCS